MVFGEWFCPHQLFIIVFFSPSCVLLQRGVRKQLWWVPGMQPGLTHKQKAGRYQGDHYTYILFTTIKSLGWKDLCTALMEFMDRCKENTKWSKNSQGSIVCWWQMSLSPDFFICYQWFLLFYKERKFDHKPLCYFSSAEMRLNSQFWNG